MKHTKTARPQRASGGNESSGHGAKSEAIREQAVLALLSEPSIGAAAARCGIGERTLRRWLAEDAAFVATYDAARHAALEAGLRRIEALTGRAVDTLGDLLDAKEAPNVRLGAARTVLELGVHQHEADTIMARLAELEAAQRLEPRERLA